VEVEVEVEALPAAVEALPEVEVEEWKVQKEEEISTVKKRQRKVVCIVCCVFVCLFAGIDMACVSRSRLHVGKWNQ
jgi:hypothetical protein